MPDQPDIDLRGSQGAVIGPTGPVDQTFINITEEVAYTVSGLPNPYLGLRAFTYDDRDAYAGRQAEIQDAVEKLTQPGEQRACCSSPALAAAVSRHSPRPAWCRRWRSTTRSAIWRCEGRLPPG